MGSSSLSANAATWHNGTPSKIRGHWEDQDVYVGKLFHNEIKYAHMSFTISKKTVDIHIGQSVDTIIRHPKWRYLGKGSYTIKGKTMYGNGRFTVKRISSSRVYGYYNGKNIVSQTPFKKSFYRVK
ncbi:hypothetical protein FD04_GL000586 [Secundilactobacillus odoratitofui DSM 19909 = JCM 15043]|uniref:Uncharacterized protein n=2 Tax=Secundilactobacillus odoratitofui TaxID=480930 RepID=A0A0R1LT48_9LACO|nr:hypothetical protein FD04_GL000586 [Secundilactobacillus odoratitofui DSM 19909 = JCM 15043]